MKTLMLMRHSHAVSNNPAFTDHERPLTNAGRKLAQHTGELLKADGFVPDHVLCSSAARTVETANLVVSATGSEAAAVVTDRFYLARPQAYAPIISQTSNQHSVVLAVGHNPAMASLVNTWADEYLSFTPASVAVFSLDIDDWSELENEELECPVLTGFFSEGTRQI
jgi:phosphohistidine phosphatase